MPPLIRQLSQYAAYHRDRRNIVSHFIGIPMIVASVALLLSRPVLWSPHLWATPASLLTALTTLYYVRLDLRYALAAAAFFAACLAGGVVLASQTTWIWLSWGGGLFGVGWVVQFLGHHLEGRKPAFLDDLIGLAIGPLFVVAEAGFLLGWRKDIENAIVTHAGPVRVTPQPRAAHAARSPIDGVRP